MAKKYKVFQNKVHWLTWTIIGIVVVGLIGLTIALQPSAKDNWYDAYSVAAAESDTNFAKKLPANNKFVLVNSLKNKLFSKGLYDLVENDNVVSIVFFGDASDASSAAIISSVYARLYGAESADLSVQASNLYKELEDSKIELYHYTSPLASFNDLVISLNEKYEDANIVSSALPTVVVFLNGKVIDYSVLTTGAGLQTSLVTLYNDVLANEEVQKLK